MCRGRPAAVTEKIREIDHPPRCFPEDESQRNFPIRRNRLRSLLACTVSGTYPQVHSGGESGVDVGLSRNTAHLRMHLFGKRVWHRFERRYSGLAEAGNFQPVAHGLLPEKNRREGVPDRWCRKSEYKSDDPELAERIRLSSAIRSKTIQLLRDYDPTKY